MDRGPISALVEIASLHAACCYILWIMHYQGCLDVFPFVDHAFFDNFFQQSRFYAPLFEFTSLSS